MCYKYKLNSDAILLANDTRYKLEMPTTAPALGSSNTLLFKVNGFLWFYVKGCCVPLNPNVRLVSTYIKGSLNMNWLRVCCGYYSLLLDPNHSPFILSQKEISVQPLPRFFKSDAANSFVNLLCSNDRTQKIGKESLQ